MKTGVIVWPVFGVSFVILVAVVSLVLAVFLSRVPSGPGRDLRIKLLYKTNHQALLDACRDLSSQVRTGKVKPGMYYFRPDPSRGVEHFPRVLQDLIPAYVDLRHDGMVIVAMMGGINHFGVVVYPDEYGAQALPLGHKQITDGLWYYDDGYDERPDWQQRIDSLEPENQGIESGEFGD